MRVLPGNLVSVTAGPILCPQLAVRLHGGEIGVVSVIAAFERALDAAGTCQEVA